MSGRLARGAKAEVFDGPGSTPEPPPQASKISQKATWILGTAAAKRCGAPYNIQVQLSNPDNSNYVDGRSKSKDPKRNFEIP